MIFSRNAKIFWIVLGVVLCIAIWAIVKKTSLSEGGHQETPTKSTAITPISGVASTQEKKPPNWQQARPPNELNVRLLKLYEVMASGDQQGSLRLVNDIIRDYPYFKLAYLIRGDLLVTQSKPVHQLGGGVVTTSEEVKQKIDYLRREAQKRAQVAKQILPTDKVPDVILRMANTVKTALVVDASNARVMVFENIKQTPVLTDVYYVTIGKKGLHKRVEGDQRTPAGVYHITESIPIERLDDFYGWGALATNYPNAWDKKLGRTGHGIWIHGVPGNTYTRSPQESDGCVVLANVELAQLFKYVQTDVTPVIITNKINWLDRAAWKEAQKPFVDILTNWHQALITGKQISFYAPDFTSDGVPLADFITQQNQAVYFEGHPQTKATRIDVDDLSIYRNPVDEGAVPMFYAEFNLIYTDGKQKQVVAKKQYWQQMASGWKIVYEGS